ncbi:hypothetical protein F511_42644 [Dorcoceras hygrometricum]|uniref:Uncharacterized protein n=1 Tax=Dorcoceras hygrometricum TaxID=472368 RepID=A0A2Z7AKG0_9LAMI|nr:hypothetical protein F511_42644 [Dorcoceras hygrometricum]
MDRSDQIVDRSYDEATVIGMNRMFIWTWARPSIQNPKSSRPSSTPLRPPPRRVARILRGWTCSDHDDEEIPFLSNSSALLEQTDEGVLFLVVDRIRRSTAAYL